MRNQLTFLFGNVPPKKNSRQFRKSKRGGYTVPSDKYNAWHEEMEAKYFRQVRLLRSPVSIAARYWAGSLSVFDLSNKQESIHDWLTDVRAITDDNAFVVQSYSCELVGLIQGCEQVEVTVTEMDWTPAQQALHLLMDKDAMRSHVAVLNEQGQKVTQKAETARLWAELEDFDEYNEKFADL